MCVSVCVILVIKDIILIKFYSRCSSVVKRDSSTVICSARAKPKYFSLYHTQTNTWLLFYMSLSVCVCWPLFTSLLLLLWFAFLFKLEKNPACVCHWPFVNDNAQQIYKSVTEYCNFLVRYVRICISLCNTLFAIFIWFFHPIPI